MPTPSELLAAAANKQTAVSTASAQKQQNLSAQQAYNNAAGMSANAGLVSATDLDKDVRTLSPSQMYGKYGDNATNLLMQQAIGDRAFANDAGTPQQSDQMAADAVMGVGMGIGNTFGGIGALGAGVISPELGAKASGLLEDFNDWGQSKQSSVLAGRRTANAARNAEAERDSAQLFEIEKEGDGVFQATLAREGRNALSAVKNIWDDNALLVDGTAQGVGSLLGIGPVAKVITKGAQAISAGAKLAPKSAALLEKAATPLAIGVIEGGSTYAQTNQEVQKLTDEQLMQNPEYATLLANKVSPADAKNILANKAGMTAAAIQAPVSVAAGKLVSKFSANPTAVGSLGSAVGNVLTEPIEEGIQSASSQVAQNLGIQQFANPNQDLGKGVGEQTGTGALFGLATAGAMQAPGAAREVAALGGKAAFLGLKAAAGSVTNGLLNRADRLTKANEAASPVSEQNMQAAADAVVNETPEQIAAVIAAIDATDAPPEEKVKAKDYVETVRASMTYDASIYPPEIQQRLADKPNRVMAIHDISQLVSESEGDAQTNAAIALYDLLQPVLDMYGADPVGLNGVTDPNARMVLDHYGSLIANMDNSPVVSKALKDIEARVTAMENGGVPTVTAEQLDTPDGQQVVKQAVMVSSLHPDRGNLATNQTILKHAAEGKITLPPNQRAALEASVALLRAEQAQSAEMERLGLKTTVDLVRDQVVSGKDPLRVIAKSALQHTRDVVKAMNAGNQEMGYDLLEDFGKFVQHMNNKVTAFNQHFEAGSPRQKQKYQQLQPTAARNFKESSDGVALWPDKPNSISLAQGVSLEAKILGDIYNGLVEAYPQLNLPTAQIADLNPELIGDAAQVSAKLIAQRNAPKTSSPAKVTPEAVTPNNVFAAISDTPFLQIGDLGPGGSLTQNMVSKADWVKLREAGVVQVDRDDDGQEYEYVPTGVLWDERERRNKEAQKNKKEITPEDKQSAIERRAQIYERIAAEQEALGDLGDTELANRMREDAAKIRQGISLRKTEGTTASVDVSPTTVSVVKVEKAPEPKKENKKVSLIGSLGSAISKLEKEASSDSLNPHVPSQASEQTIEAVDAALSSLYSAATRIVSRLQALGTVKAKELKEELDALKVSDLLELLGKKTLPADGVVTDILDTANALQPLYQEVVAYAKEVAAKQSSLFDSGVVEAKTEKTPEPKKQDFTNAQIAAMTGEQLNSHLDAAMDKPGYQQDPTFIALDEQMTKLENEAAAELAAEEAKKEEPVVSQPNTAREAVLDKVDAFISNLTDERLNELADDTGGKNARRVEDELTTRVETTKVEEAPVPDDVTQDFLFPSLAHGEANKFHKAYKVPETARTRVIGTDAVIGTVRNALRSTASLDAFIGGNGSTNVLSIAAAKAYKQLLGAGFDSVVQAMDKNLAEVMSKSGDYYDKNPVMARTAAGKALSITEKVGKTFQYNKELQETAVLAGLQWVLSAPKTITSLSAEDVAEFTGVNQALLTQEDIAAMNRGTDLVRAKQAIAAKVLSYWGLQSNKAVDTAYSEGIHEAVAAEVMRALIDSGLMGVERVTFTPQEHGIEKQKDFDRYVPETIVGSINEFPDAIDQAVLIERVPETFIGEDAIPPVPFSQMNRPHVPLTAEQKQAIKNEQATVLTLNLPMVNFIGALGIDTIINLFGGGDLESKPFNENHKKSLVGKNQSLSAAYEALYNLTLELQGHATKAGKAITEIPVRYGYGISSVGRLQMLSAQNPQASKLMREAMLPTWSTTDLNDAQAFQNFELAIGQAIGFKVHNMSRAEMSQKVQAALTGKLAPALEVIRDWQGSVDVQSLESEHTFTPQQAQLFKDALGGDLSFVALHALVEYVRFERSTPDERKVFKTALYVEADGVTNGPINAMALLTAGRFSLSWLQNMSKGGFTIGAKSTYADLAKGQNDLYQTAADWALKFINAEMAKPIMSDEDLALFEQKHGVFALLDMFLPGVTFDPSKNFQDTGGALEVERGVSKNPLTTTLYGSGVTTIAEKMTKQVSDAIYERMSFAAQAMEADKSLSLAEALFPNSNEPDAQLEKFQSTMAALTQKQVDVFEGDMFLTDSGYVYDPSSDPVNFLIDKRNTAAIAANIEHLFVAPLRAGIEKTVGDPVMKASNLIVKTTSVQSILFKYVYEQEEAKFLADRVANDPEYRKGDFMSPNDRAAIMKKVMDIFPLVQTDGQDFLVNKNAPMDRDTRSYSRALDGTMRTPPNFSTPEVAGVSGVPSLVIGMGDAKMMLLLALNKAMTGTLKVFDGMNMPLDKLTEYSELANKAVLDSWQDNMFGHLADSYGVAMQSMDKVEMSPQLIQDLGRSMDMWRGRDTWPEFEEKVRDAAKQQLKTLDQYANSVGKRQAVLASMPQSLDHMASVGAPYANHTSTVEYTHEQVLAELNKRYKEGIPGAGRITATRVKAVPQAEPKKEDPKVTALGIQQRSSGAYVLSPTALKNLYSKGDLTPAQKEIFGEIQRSLATKDWSVVVGSEEQLAAYHKENGMPGMPVADGEVFGYTNVASKTVFLVNPSMETLVHELVHAASYETTYEHYKGNSTPEVKDAIKRIETLMRQFMDVESTDEGIRNAQAAIQEHQSNMELDVATAKASALNEFMAWGLTNQQVTEQLAATRAPTIVQMAKDVVAALKKLIWGKNKAPAVADDVLSNLRFNAGIVIRASTSLSGDVRTGNLFHSAHYGSSERITAVREAFERKITDYLITPAPLNQPLKNTVGNKAKMDAGDLRFLAEAQGFTMTPQEAATFQMIVAALSTQAEIDPSAMAKAQQLYEHVLENLTVDSFIGSQDPTNPGVVDLANRQFSLINGLARGTPDALGRSTLLPTFLALATVHDGFRSILNSIPVPKNKKNTAQTLDALLENTGNDLMDKLSAYASGTNKTNTVKEAIDTLQVQIQKTANDEKTIIDQFSTKVGGLRDRANEIVVQGLDQLSDKGIAFGKKLEAKANNPYSVATAKLVQGMSGIVSEKNVAGVATAVIANMNKSAIPLAIREFVGDVIGRTENNASVFDMIKTTRATTQQLRQQFREEVPRIIASKFTRELTKDEWSALFRGLGKSDLAVWDKATAQAVLSNVSNLNTEIAALESTIKADAPRLWTDYERKAKQLANYMNTGVYGGGLLRNANAVAHLLNVRKGVKPTADTITNLDKLITLYSLQGLNQEGKTILSSLVQSEQAGVDFALSYLQGQRKEEQTRAESDGAKFNYYKGHIPFKQNGDVSLVVADDNMTGAYMEASHQNVGAYKGSSLVKEKGRSYFFAPVSGQAVFNQGIIQNVRPTASGVDVDTGFTMGMTAGRVLDPVSVKNIARHLERDTSSEPFLPVFDANGEVYALERSIDPIQLSSLVQGTNLAEQIGVWRGRQVEEARAGAVNEELVKHLHDMYIKDMKESSHNQKQYVNLLDPNNKDKVTADAVSLLGSTTKAVAEDAFGKGEFWVRKDMLNDAIGYRSATVTDIWSGTTRWNDTTQDMMKRMVLGAFGNEAFAKLSNLEKGLQGLIADARTLIVVKSIVVPMANFASNIAQLMLRGVPPLEIARSMPKKLSEINDYTKSRLRQIDLEAELRATAQLAKQATLRAEIRSITDSHKRLSIWPLIEAGEFSSISDVGMTHEDVELSSGKLYSYLEKQVDKLPDGMKTVAKYGLITKDTALFKGLQKSVQYGDFVAKAVMYDQLTKRKGNTQAEALAQITEEYVNYDRLGGRSRNYLENVGLLWFYNFKIRSLKVGMSILRNQPLNALLFMTTPLPSSIGSPIDDNILSKAIQGTLGYSAGYGQALGAPGLNPWVAISQ